RSHPPHSWRLHCRHPLLAPPSVSRHPPHEWHARPERVYPLLLVGNRSRNRPKMPVSVLIDSGSGSCGLLREGTTAKATPGAKPTSSQDFCFRLPEATPCPALGVVSFGFEFETT